jgi:hypothetical protein
MRLKLILLLLSAVLSLGGELAVPVPGEINAIVPVRSGRGKSSEFTFTLHPGADLEITWLALPRRCPVAVERPDGKLIRKNESRYFRELPPAASSDEFSRALQPSLVLQLQGAEAVPGRYRVLMGPMPLWGKVSCTMVIAAPPQKAE